MSALPCPRPVLFYRVSPANHGVVFATPERALETDRIRGAIAGSRTWGEFRAAMPEDDYELIAALLFDLDDLDRPDDDEPFVPERVPGYVDGDYPPWLQKEMESVLPWEVVERFGKRLQTAINGIYLHIDEEYRARVVATLMRAGYRVVRREDLEFW